MTRKGTILAVLVGGTLLFHSGTVRAQTFKDLFLNVWEWSVRPKAYLDSAYVFQPAKSWSFSLGNEWVDPGFHVSIHKDLKDPNDLAEYDVQLQVNDRSFHNIGIHASYGALRVGLSREIGRKDGKNTTFTFNWLSTSYGLKFKYSSYMEFPEGQIKIKDLDDDWNYESQLYTSEYLSNLRLLVVDGFYAFNRHKFSYISAYNGRMVQRRSAGSWMVAAKYMYGDLRLNQDDAIFLGFTHNLGRFSTHQVSLGGGYSINWIPFHREAVSAHNMHGLRNLTFNLTALPMITFYNRVITMDYDKDAESHPHTGRIRPNFLARAGGSYAFGHFFVSLWADYNICSFSTPPRDFRTPKGGTMTNSSVGYFSRWNAALEINFRF